MNYILVTLFLICFHFLPAQHLVKGKVEDQDTKPLTGATVVLLENQDSSMVAFSISDKDGIFNLEDVDTGKYVLQMTFVSFKSISRPLIISDNDKNIDLGVFQLEGSYELLQEVTVKAEHIPMGLIGDTISYNAAAFKVSSGASVEDLLKKLPGIEVQRDGSIKAMGEKVENVLVDGREFFGDDPKIATQNLEAEAVDKVEVFDKKSEIAEFTGIDDGQEEKTINLKLKEGFKSGGFGKLELAGGTESRYQSKLNYNRFSPRMQTAAIISANNINKQAFTFNEYIQFMGGLGNALGTGMGMLSFGEFSGGRAPEGLSDDISGGLNFNYDLSKKLRLTSYYFYLNTDKVLENQTLSNQFTESLDFITSDSALVNNGNKNHRIHAKLEFNPGPFTQIVWKNTISGIIKDLNSQTFTSFFQSGLEAGKTNSFIVRNNDQRGYEGNLQLRRKFGTNGRNWINTISYQIGYFDEENNVKNDYQFISNPIIINQRQEYHFDKNILSLATAYTEPLGHQYYLGFNYYYDLDYEKPGKDFFDFVTNDLGVQVAQLNDELSNLYSKTNHIHKGEISIKKNNKRMKLNSSMGFQNTTILGKVGENQIIINNKDLHFLPSISWEYDLTSDNTIEIGYRTSVNLPTLNQLAPLPDNSNPTMLVTGNPNLIPEYVHNWNIGYHSIDQFNFKNFFLNASINRISHRIVNRISINENFIKTITPENTDKFTRISGFGSYSAPIRPLKLKYDISTQYSWSSYESSINNLVSNVKEGNTFLRFAIENRMKDHVDLATGIRLDYSTRKYEVNEHFNQKFFNSSLFIDGTLYLKNEWTVTASYDYVSYSSEFFSEGQKFNLLNCSIRKSFADDKVAIEIRVNDILNQNKGIQRSGNINSLYETRYNTLARYAMFGIIFKFGKRKENGAIHLD